MEKKQETKKSPAKRILQAVALIVTLALMGGLVYILVSTVRGDVTFIAGKTVVWVKTGSMAPTIPERTYILMEKADPKTLAVGDVILFYSDDPTLNGDLNTHRIVEIVGDHEEFVTRGDNNPKEDDYTAKADKVVAVYRKNLPLLSGLGQFFATPAGLAVIIVTLLGITAAIYVPDIVRASREKTAEDAKKRQELMDEKVREEVERLKAEAQSKKAPEEKKAPETGADTDKEDE